MKNKKLIEFTKMTATGNDFIIIGVKSNDLVRGSKAEFVRKVCDRHFGVGADGLFFIHKPKDVKSHFQWDFYNADGSNAEMCGNGSRCVARYAFDKKIAPKKMKFETRAGVIEAVVGKAEVKILMPKPKCIFKSVSVPAYEDKKFKVGYWDTGVPHVVLETQNWKEEFLYEAGAYLRNYEAFKKTNGANVTFYEVVGPSQVQAATFERGVEGVTLACGTGAVAAAAEVIGLGHKSPVQVRMPGGTLRVEIPSDFSFAKLTGPARYISEGTLNKEIYL